MTNRIAISHRAMAVHHGHGVEINQRIKMRKSILKEFVAINAYANEKFSIIIRQKIPSRIMSSDELF